MTAQVCTRLFAVCLSAGLLYAGMASTAQARDVLTTITILNTSNYPLKRDDQATFSRNVEVVSQPNSALFILGLVVVELKHSDKPAEPPYYQVTYRGVYYPDSSVTVRWGTQTGAENRGCSAVGALAVEPEPEVVAADGSSRQTVTIKNAPRAV